MSAEKKTIMPTSRTIKNLWAFLLFGTLILIGVVRAAAHADPGKYFRILPKPQSVQWLQGKGIAPSSLTGIRLQGKAVKPVLFGHLGAISLSPVPGKGVVVLNLADQSGLPASMEGYVLEIKDQQVTVTSRGQAGLFYGCQTLGQLIEDAREQRVEIPSCKITDYPGQPYRSVHLDLKHHLDAGHYYYSIIDRLAQIKVNAVIVEFEDKLRYRKAPVVGAGNAISVEEFAAISRYAKDRHIEISPLVQGLGHASFILKHEPYKTLRDNPASDWAFDALNPGTYDLQFALYEDAIAATPGGKYLHVGGDEVGELGMSELAKKSGKQPFELQMYWLRKVCDFATRHNRIPVFWDDMLFKLSGVYEPTHNGKISSAQTDSIWKANEPRLTANIGLFPKNCIYMRWNYWDATIPGNRKAIDWYKKNGLTVMAATAAQTSWPMMPREHSNINAIKSFCKVASEQQMDGILCTVWDDASPHFETVWRGLHHFASYSWNYNDDKVEDASRVFRQRFYGAALADSAYEVQDDLEHAMDFWEAALLEKGHRYNYPDSIHLISIPEGIHSGGWNRRYAARIAKAQKEVMRYEKIRGRIARAKLLATRNEYNLDLFQQVNELQVYPSKLLLLFAAYDAATANDKKRTAREDITAWINGFEDARKNYEAVYSATRFISNPDGYVLDQNGHHHLANGTANSDWMYVYELAMIKRIRQWVAGK